MKKLLLLLLFIAPVYCFAQADSLKYKPKEEFCEVNVFADHGGYRIKISDKDEKSVKVAFLKDSTNKVKQFYTMVGVYNYMAQHGWVLVSSYTAVSSGEWGDIHLIYKRAL